MTKIQAEYIWLDGYASLSKYDCTARLRSKTKIVDSKSLGKNFWPPDWGFDGSSTEQATGKESDCLLKPVFWCPDPIRKDRFRRNILVMCEVLNSDGTPHPSNTRAQLAKVAEKYAGQDAWFGFEQEYTLFKSNGLVPLAWPDAGTPDPGPQGPYYCGVGAEVHFGRPLVEAHTQACLDAGLSIAGTNPEVMPGQHEFQIGALGAPEVADQFWVARWLLKRLGENFGIVVSFNPKPRSGDWNGAGCHTNFSTKSMRKIDDPRLDGFVAIHKAAIRLADRHKEHLTVYGSGNENRLTGQHETCDINTFRYGIGDRSASVRIPAPVATAGKGYLEDRRPAANCDPYLVCIALLETICGSGFNANFDPYTPKNH